MKKSFLIFILLILPSIIVFADAKMDSPDFEKDRKEMVYWQIRMRGISDPKVISSMETIPRHIFVPENLADKAYEDYPLPIGEGQTISQPYIVALMTESLGLKGNEKVLEIGTGSGYQAAVLSRIANKVFTIEIRKKLFEKARETLKHLNLKIVETFYGDGYFGLKENAPYDCIMITAAIDHIPPPLLKQLKTNGKLILPLGNPFGYQNLSLVIKSEKDYQVKQITGCLFVPMTGFALDNKRND